ncbi:terpene synthase family protein [Pseudomonas mandelii]|uniref:terpene synthase family protein n=1 Tax=Pseudomonas mandelii TaxID=75612 RepID=UPI0020A00CA9|nr:terpene synthase [Pseudomonas mandelii]MCO8309057.1 terpene synthase [Pseudomonas mandelii]
MSIITLPNIYCPFTHIQHPKAEQFGQSTADWLQHWELYWDDKQRQRMIRPGWGLLASLAYPKGTDELIQIASDWMAWAFAYDDEWCDEGPVTKKPETIMIASARMSRALECPEYPVDPNDRYSLSMQELRIRLEQHATPIQVNRVVEAQKGYFMGEIVKAGCMYPELSECTFLRLTGGGGMLFPTLTHAVAGIDIHQDDFIDRRIVAMTEMAATFVLWENEFFSYAKESMRDSLDTRGNNMIDAIRRHFGCSTHDALTWLNSMHDRIMGLFVRLREQLLQNASPEVERYIQALIHYQTGVLEWHRRDERYRVLSPGDSTPCYKGGHSTDQPHDQSFDPVPIPSIQWWWDYDPARSSSVHRFHPNDHVVAARKAGREFNACQEPYTYKKQQGQELQ